MDDKNDVKNISIKKAAFINAPQITAVLYCSLVSVLFWREYFYRRITG